jgi:CRISPR type I-E-associated protein CasB/Cse2
VGDIRSIDDYALAAGLFAIYHQGSAPDDVARGNLGASFGALCARDAGAAPAAERRLQELLGLDRESLPEQLRRAATLLRSKGVAIDWAALACDLAHWDSPEREVQEAWMTGFVVRSIAPPSEWAVAETDAHTPTSDPTVSI